MKMIKPSVELVNCPTYNNLLSLVEQAGRVCYKSEAKIDQNSAEPFVQKILWQGHESVIEHASFSVRFICDRGVSHEIVRHRLASYSQESTRYCNYSQDRFNGEITVIEPIFLEPGTLPFEVWFKAMKVAESAYFSMLEAGCSPQEARAVLPNSLKTELIMTANVREWRHFLKLRTSDRAHPQMKEIAKMLLEKVCKLYPVFFEDIERWLYYHEKGVSF